MKTLALSLLALSSVAWIHTAAATPTIRTLDVPTAETFASGLLEWRSKNHVQGSIKRGLLAYEDLFADLDAQVGTLLGPGLYQSRRLSAEEDALKVVIEEIATHKLYSFTTSRQRVLPQLRSVVRWSHMTHLVIEESSSWRNALSGRFVTLTRSPGNDYLEAGQQIGAFTLSVFGVAIANQTVAGGVALGTTVPLSNGWELSFRGQVSAAVPMRMSLTEGAFEQAAFSKSVSLTIRKTFSSSGVYASAGANLTWNASGQMVPQISVGLGKTFTNSVGEEVAKLDLVGVADVSGDRPSWMVGVMLSFQF